MVVGVRRPRLPLSPPGCGVSNPMRRVLVCAALPALVGLAVTLPLLPSPARGDDPAKPYSPFVAAASREGEQAIKRFRLPAGLKAELFAAERLVANIVAFNFDEKGRC